MRNRVTECEVKRIELTVLDIMDAGKFGSGYDIDSTYYLRDIRDKTNEGNSLIIITDVNLIFKTKQDLLNSL